MQQKFLCLLLPCTPEKSPCSHPEGHTVQGSAVQDTHSWLCLLPSNNDIFNWQETQSAETEEILLRKLPRFYFSSTLNYSPGLTETYTHILGPLSEENSQ